MQCENSMLMLIFCYLLASPVALFVVWSFCGGTFKSLGRHAWHYKEKAPTKWGIELFVLANSTTDYPHDLEVYI